jgi:hypothetical protein
MPAYTVHAHRARITATFERASKIDDAETQADLARFLVVLTSGFLEKAIAHIYAEYAKEAGGSARIIRYAQRRLESFQNPNVEKILQLAGDLDPEWRGELEAYLQGERKDHIDSVVANRHQIAHGENVGVTYRRASDYFKSADDVVTFIDSLCRS